MQSDSHRGKEAANAYIKLQKALFGMTESTYQKTFLMISNSEIMNHVDKIDELLHLFLEAIDIRPKGVLLYVKLFQDIITIMPEFFGAVEDFLLSTTDRKTKRLYFLFLLYQSNIISKEKIILFIHSLFEDKAYTYMKIHRKLAVSLFCWFSPELSESPSFNKYFGLLKEAHDSPYFKTIVNINLPFLQDYQILSNNNWEKLIKYRIKGMSYDPIAISIVNDEIMQFDDVDGEIKSCVFESCSFLNHSPTYLQYAAFHGSVGVFKYLLENGADMTKHDRKNRKLEEYAIAGGCSEIISIVFKDHQQQDMMAAAHPIQITHKNVRNGRRRRNDAIDIGAERTFSGCSNRTQKRGNLMQTADLTDQQEKSHFLITSGGYSNYTVAKFNRFGVIPPQIDEKVFFESCKCDCIELVIYAIENGMDPNIVDSENNPALSIACRYGNVDIVKYMASFSQTNLSATDRIEATPLIIAASNGHLPVVRFLCSRDDVDINSSEERQTTALVFGAMKGYYKIVSFLLDQKGVDLNAMDEYYGPAYVHAAMHGHLDIIKLLANKEKNGLNMHGDYVSFAIIFAAQRGYIDVIKYLQTKSGVDLKIKNIYDENVLTSAATGHQLETIKYLLTNDGIDVNQKGPNGNSALMVAASMGDLEIVRYLSDYPGIDIHLKNNYEANALKLAISNKHFEIVEFLRNVGCKDE